MTTSKRLRIASAVLVASLGVFVALSPAQTPAPKRPAPKVPAAAQQSAPAEYQAGISQLRVAKAYLQKAGDKWGRISHQGHRDDGPNLQDARCECRVNPQRNAIR